MRRREVNFELLRIIAMLMIITLHYLDKGGILVDPQEESGTLAGNLAWLLEAFCVSSVNVYVLISAYFLVETKYRPGKVLSLWAQCFFYSVSIAVVGILCGILATGEWDVYRLLPCIFPVVGEHYWFVTAYLIMILLTPLMNDGLHRMEKKVLQKGILFLLIMFSLAPSVLPVKLPTDRMGYDALWFMCLYLIGAYIRLYGLPFEKGKWAMGGYLLCSLGIFASYLGMHELYRQTGKLGDYINRQYHYNSILCLLASICLFQWFRGWQLREGKVSRTIAKLATVSFGVYLIHEHLLIRYMWPQWLRVYKVSESPVFLLYWPVAVCVVYLACGLVEYGRQRLFGTITSYIDRQRENRG